MVALFGLCGAISLVSIIIRVPRRPASRKPWSLPNFHEVLRRGDKSAAGRCVARTACEQHVPYTQNGGPMALVDVDSLRAYLLDYCGAAAFSGFPAALLDMADIERASGQELCRIAECLGIDLR